MSRRPIDSEVRTAASAEAAPSTAALAGCLYVVGTPIGNLEDITLRALRVLGQVPVLAAEDTRAARHLLQHHGLALAAEEGEEVTSEGRRLLSFFEGNEAQRVPQLPQLRLSLAKLAQLQNPDWL